MATTEQTFVLVEMEMLTEAEIKTEGAGRPEIIREVIKGVIRTYLSSQRVEEDLELLHETNAGGRYMVLSVPHIDS